MGAILVAAGRGVRPGTELGEVRVVDVAPTVLAWLGIEAPTWMDGRPIDALVADRREAEPAPGSQAARIGE
jgi:arylsulfatase A-like enzyme